MAKDKKSFLLYCDIIHTVNKLPDDKAGILFKHILKYVNNENPILEDIILDIAFEPIKQALKRDLKKYEIICERNSNNGKKGGRPKNPNEPKKPSGLINNPKNPNEPKKPDIDIDIDIDIEKNINISFSEFWNLYNKKVGDKNTCEKKWNKLKDIDREQIIKTLPTFISSISNKQFQPYPSTYLNQRRWEDETENQQINTSEMFDNGLSNLTENEKEKLYIFCSNIPVKERSQREDNYVFKFELENNVRNR